MSDSILTKLFEHNNWANMRIIHICSTLTDEQLDAEPLTATKGTIRITLAHLVNSQEDYLSQLLGIEARFDWQVPPDFATLQQAASSTGEGLIALTRSESNSALHTTFHKDGYAIEPWVVMVQAINHATEHREQIKSMLNALDITPPRIDGWAYGTAVNALIQVST
jgi:uncharacterized damage-inducible protein DinB